MLNEAVSSVSNQGASVFVPWETRPPERVSLDGNVLHLHRGRGGFEAWKIGNLAAATATTMGSLLVVEFDGQGKPARARQLSISQDSR